MAGFRQDKSITDNSADLSLDDFDYNLPAELIAQEPAKERSSSRLMVLSRESKQIEHKQFSDLLDYLMKGDLLVLNDTKVIPARINARRASGGAVEILLLKPEATRPGVWQAMASPLRKLREGDLLSVETADGETATIRIAGFCESPESQRRVLIDFGGNAEVHSLLSRIGQAPLPPYILHERSKCIVGDLNLQSASSRSTISRGEDLERYQTVYAKVDGAVAAPTAGLHFSAELLDKLKAKGVEIAYLTLHVGPGTFKPITTTLAEHTVESEEFFISDETAELVNKVKQNGGRVIAVGTTSCRALETAGASGKLEAAFGIKSSLYIRPGYKFAIVDALVTNFHLNRSSLLVLVSSFAGHEFIMNAYKEAIAQRYRFYSYGDAMFIY